MPLVFGIPLIPAASIAIAGAITGRVLTADNNDANVVVNTSAQNQGLTNTLTRAALYGGTALAVVFVAPRLLPSKK